MDPKLYQRLVAEVRIGGAAYARNCAAAETAIYQGQFNVAKILRAAGHAQRVIAMNAARLLQPSIEATQMFETILSELHGEDGNSSPPDKNVDDAELQLFLDRADIVRSRLRVLLERSIKSLVKHPDVLERDVNIFIWGCYDCGNLVEGERPKSCDLCGAPEAEFQWFGPYFAQTPERLGRLLPTEEIIAILSATPTALAEAVTGVEDAVLEQRPTQDEWSAKEIVAHFIETDRLFLKRSSEILSSPAPVPPFSSGLPPWKTHEGKGYEQMPVNVLVEQFMLSRAGVLDVLNALTADDWSSMGHWPDAMASMLDLGRWLANHDLGHMVHIRRQTGKA